MPFAAGSNGLAGGNHILEALAAALYEVVERDAIACSRASAGGGMNQRVDLATVTDPSVRSLIDQFDNADVSAYLFDITVDTMVPAYTAVVADRRDPAMGLYRGYGAHLDPSIAMIRALTEAAQARLLLIAGSRDDYFTRDQRMNRFMSDGRREHLRRPSGNRPRRPATVRRDHLLRRGRERRAAAAARRGSRVRDRCRSHPPRPADPGRAGDGARARGLHVRLLPTGPARRRACAAIDGAAVTSILERGATGKGLRADAQRAMTPEQTLQRVRGRFGAIGLTRLANITGLDCIGIPVVLSVRPQAGYLSVDGGKGFTLGCGHGVGCDGVFRAACRVRTPRWRASPPATPTSTTSARIPLEQLPLSRNSLFSPDLAEQWVMADDLSGGPAVAVPTVIVALERFRHRRSSLLPFSFSSNGLNSGNTKAEALIGALYEVIERDATTCSKVGWRGRRSAASGRPVHRDRVRTSPPWSTPPAPPASRWWSSTAPWTPLVPTFSAYLCDVGNPTMGLYHGYGTHLDPQVAVIRAICEAAQGRLVYIAGSRDDCFGHHRRFRATFEEANAQLLGRPETVDLQQFRDDSGDTFEADGRTLLRRLRAIGIHRVLAVDMTHPDVGVDVFRVVVPGLEGYMLEDFTPGPRAQAWARAAIDQEVTVP